MSFDKEMQRALEADGEKLHQLTGEDHGPHFVNEPEPTPVEILAMDLADLQDGVAELFDRLSGKRVDDVDEEEMSPKERYGRMLALIQAVVGEKR